MSQPPPDRPPDGPPGAGDESAAVGAAGLLPHAAPGGAGGNQKRTLPALVAVLLVVLVVAAVLALTRRGGGRLDTSANSDVATPAPTSRPSPRASSGALASPESAAPSGAPFTSSSTAQPDLVQAVLHRYPDQATRDAVFQGQATTEWVLSAVADGACCPAATGYGPWSHPDRTRGGQLACQITGEGDVLLAWTDDAFLTARTVRVPGNSQAALTALHDWRTPHRDFRP